MALNVYKKYGAVPKDLFPETESSKNTGAMNTQLRHLLHTAVAHMYADPASIDDEIAKTVAAGHRILTIHLASRRRASTGSGPTPRACSTATAKSRPSSSGRSTWAPPTLRITCASWTIRAASTPRARRSASSTWQRGRRQPDRVPERAEPVHEGLRARDPDRKGIPVWFGADCGPFMDRERGAWATDLFEYGSVYDVDFDMDKESCVRFGDSR